MNKYEVKCKCGHVGRKNYIIINFPIIAESVKEAAYKARKMPRVKHNHKDAILSVKKITNEEYSKLIITNMEDDYLHCSCKQEQNLIDLEDRIYKEESYIEEDGFNEEHKRLYFGKIEIRNPKKYFKDMTINDYDTEECI